MRFRTRVALTILACGMTCSAVDRSILTARGYTIVEVKTGGATLSNNQRVVYPAVQSGTATAAGGNALKILLDLVLPKTSVIILRRP